MSDAKHPVRFASNRVGHNWPTVRLAARFGAVWQVWRRCRRQSPVRRGAREASSVIGPWMPSGAVAGPQSQPKSCTPPRHVHQHLSLSTVRTVPTPRCALHAGPAPATTANAFLPPRSTSRLASCATMAGPVVCLAHRGGLADKVVVWPGARRGVARHLVHARVSVVPGPRRPHRGAQPHRQRVGVRRVGLLGERHAVASAAVART